MLSLEPHLEVTLLRSNFLCTMWTCSQTDLVQSGGVTWLCLFFLSYIPLSLPYVLVNSHNVFIPCTSHSCWGPVGAVCISWMMNVDEGVYRWSLTTHQNANRSRQPEIIPRPCFWLLHSHLNILTRPLRATWDPHRVSLSYSGVTWCSVVWANSWKVKQVSENSVAHPEHSSCSD